MSTKAKKRPNQPAPPPPPKKIPILWILGGLVGVALVGAIAVSLSGETSTSGAVIEIGSPTTSGDSLAPYVRGTSDPTIGSVIPTATGTDFDEAPVVIDPGDGAAGIVFLAHWCGHCQAEVPVVQDWLDGGAVPAARLLSVATSIDETRPNYPPWSWLDREGWTTPVLVDDAAGSVMRAFGGTEFPFWVFVNDAGEVVARVSGEIGAEALAGFLELAAGA
ncbi:MAG: TlpA family protein disulfide reductase [Acidimicrobiia bacterium]|nr:TlpA family protein disulfide reductase [Acidimicrobiia bacterium]